MNWINLRAVFMHQLAVAIPWLLAGLGLTAAVSLSPLGRALLRHLRERKREATLNEAVLTEITELRGTLSELVERLDTTEQRLRTLR